MTKVKIEVDEIQGIVLRDYLPLPFASFLLLGFGEAAPARAWLAGLADEVTPTRVQLDPTCVNVAFTPAGLGKLGLPEDVMKGFEPEFLEGIAGDRHRSSILGDVDECAPSTWGWGGPDNPALDGALLLYAGDHESHQAQLAEHRARLEAAGIQVLAVLDTTELPEGKEHFGFRDGISQPRLANGNPDHERVGVLERQLENNTIPAGELLLGYVNGYGVLPSSPMLPSSADPGGVLPIHGWGGRDFGRNGSYLVLRQLSQDVSAFWSHLQSQRDPDESLEQVGAKMVGRWTNGSPLAKAPDGPIEGTDEEFSDFAYMEEDARGMRCPIGSHLRRCNPRDSLMPDGPKESVKSSNLHRIVRRGRPYGPPLDPELRPEKMAESSDGAARGLHFLGFNADLSRQFEFIQHNWINYPKFNNLYTDEDPLVGARRHRGNDTFTIQDEPVRRRVTSMPRFVKVRGGAYFFMPSLSALRYLGSIS